MRQVSRWLGPEAQQIGIAEMLQETAESLRQPYIDYIGTLGAEQESDDWWFSSLSEKNPELSRAFLHICYVAVAARLARQYADFPMLFLVIESAEVRRAVARHLRESGVRFIERVESCLSRTDRAIREWGEMLVRKGWGVGRQVYRMVVARVLGFSAVVRGDSTDVVRPWILLHNWLDARSFDNAGGYHDTFFGSLRDAFQKRGFPVAVVAAALYKSPYLRLLIRLRRSGIPALVPHAALTFGTLLRWSLSLMVRPPQRHVWARFEGFDVSEILDVDKRTDWMNARVSDVFLIRHVVHQWRRHLDVQSFIYTYEGHTWERGYCRAFRQHFPKALLVGYQHGILSPMYLSHFISGAEWGKIPFPDRIVANGPYHYDLLRRNGIPEKVLLCGGTFRYTILGKDPSALTVSRSGQATIRILVAFSVFLIQAAELLWAVVQAFADSTKYSVVLKFHPSLRASRVAAAAGIDLSSLPSHMQVVDRPLAYLFNEVDVLVYMETRVAVEALACGIPVVHLMSSHGIDMDRLGQFDGARVSAGTAEGLRAAVERVLKAGAEEQTTRIRCWREAVNALLPPTDEKTIDLFMPENVR